MSPERRILQVAFADEDHFRREYVRNIANGGVFVGTREVFAMAELVRVEIALDYCDEHFELEGEVVHRVPPDLEPEGAVPGVAIQFSLSAAELRERLEPLAGAIGSGDERVDRTGQRAASRGVARVSVRVAPRDGTPAFESRTRNLSATGALLSAENGAAANGEALDLVLRHPRSGEELAVAAEVVRCVSNQLGEVSAIGVEFRPAAGARARLNRFVADLKASEHAARLGGIEGAIAELGIESLLQMFCTCAPQGTMVLSRGDEEGLVAFEKGLLHSAQLGEARGIEALSRLLSWRDGRFEFQARMASELRAAEPLALQAALLDAACHVDERRRLDLGNLPLSATLSLDEAQLLEAGPLSRGEEAIVELARVGLHVAKVIEVIPEADAEIYNALAGLFERGIVDVHGGEEP